ncbi:M17 family metallopeptidase [Spiroplasma endosymbiont of Labia minor]|uniref:M17 family metallopeptidase n=1 Tax=Spiroplasma endosymbiont of Labia minor TaxID=3066305 RepID=UPI0030CD7BDB
MITLNKKDNEITLNAINKKNITNNLIIKTEGELTLISEEKIIYLVIEKEKSREKLIELFRKAFSTIKYSVNINFESFIEFCDEPEDILFGNMVETVAYINHKGLSFKKKEENSEININFIVNNFDFEKIFQLALIKSKWVNFARDLQDTPPNIGTATYFANKFSEIANKFSNIKLSILTKEQIKDKKMGLLLGVNAASYEEPRIVVIEYNKNTSKTKTGLVGKGITFDSGGYSLKPSNYMEGMKFDMTGAAVVLSTVLALAEANADANVVGVGVFTDNRIGGHGTLVESVLTSYNGQTVEISNTDAEGRLVLADGITYALRDCFANRIVTVATLTGSIVIALGKWATGAFTKQEDFWLEMKNASASANESIWRMPLQDYHLEVMQKGSNIADLTNAEKGKEAGSSTAAAFLDSFAENKPFIHLDIAGTGDFENRGTGVLLKTLFEMLN